MAVVRILLGEHELTYEGIDEELGAGELNIGGGGIGPISETGIGGSGSSDRVSGASAPGGGGVHSLGELSSQTETKQEHK